MPYVNLITNIEHKFELPRLANKPDQKRVLVLDKYSHIFENEAFLFSGHVETRDSATDELIKKEYDKWVGDKNIFICIDPTHALSGKQLNVRGEKLIDIINRLNPAPPKPRDLAENETATAEWLAEKAAYVEFEQWIDLPFNYTTQYDYLYSEYVARIKPMFSDFLDS